MFTRTKECHKNDFVARPNKFAHKTCILVSCQLIMKIENGIWGHISHFDLEVILLKQANSYQDSHLKKWVYTA